MLKNREKIKSHSSLSQKDIKMNCYNFMQHSEGRFGLTFNGLLEDLK